VEMCVTMDAKQPGNVLFLVGVTKAELGGSHYELVHGLSSTAVPQPDLDRAPRIFRAIHAAITSSLVRSCHDLSEGGLAVAIAEMAFAGGLGIDASLNEFGKMDETIVLFSESNSRFLVEVEEDLVDQFTELIRREGNLPLVRLGSFNESGRVAIRGCEGDLLINESIDVLKACWQERLSADV
jgi:phosphoribosylformylglycinamidine (FGAM) synthase-like enzyme